MHRVRRADRTPPWLAVGDDTSVHLGKGRYKVGAAFEKRWFCDGVSRRGQPGKLQDKGTSYTAWEFAAFKDIHPPLLCVRKPSAS